MGKAREMLLELQPDIDNEVSLHCQSAVGMNSLWNWRTKAMQGLPCFQSRKNTRKQENLKMESEKKKQDNLASSKSCDEIDFIKLNIRGSFQGYNFTWICSSSTRHSSKVVLWQWLLSMLMALIVKPILWLFQLPPRALISLHSNEERKDYITWFCFNPYVIAR